MTSHFRDHRTATNGSGDVGKRPERAFAGRQTDEERSTTDGEIYERR